MSPIPDPVQQAAAARDSAPRDRALWSIVAANALTLVFALWQGWGMIHLLWPFWIQSVIIGYYARRRMLMLQEFSTDGFRINDRAVQPTAETRVKTANFFALHYGFFHFMYLIFLLAFTFTADAAGMATLTNADTGAEHPIHVGRVTGLDVPILLALGLGFWASHRQSFHEHVAADLRRRPNIGALMFLPYARVIPMHLTIILGAFLGGTGAVLLFGLLKTGADVLMHKVEHAWMQGGWKAHASP